MIYKQKEWMKLAIIIYAGVVVMILPSFFYGSYKNDIWCELLPYAGLLIMIAGVVWFFTEKIISKLNSINESSRSLINEGVKEISVLHSERVRHLVRSSLSTTSVRFFVNSDWANKVTLEMLDFLCHEGNKSYDTKIIVVDSPDKSKSEVSFEKSMFFQMLNKTTKESIEGLSIKITSKQYNTSFCIARNAVYLLTQFDPKGLNMLQVNVDKYSDVGMNYTKLFDELWSEASSYKAIEI